MLALLTGVWLQPCRCPRRLLSRSTISVRQVHVCMKGSWLRGKEKTSRTYEEQASGMHLQPSLNAKTVTDCLQCCRMVSLAWYPRSESIHEYSPPTGCCMCQASASMIAARSLFVRKTAKLLCGERWSSNRIAVDGATAAKSLSEMPTPRGALPFLGHHLLLREHREKISQLYYDLSKQFGPIFKLKLPAGMSGCAIITVPYEHCL